MRTLACVLACAVGRLCFLSCYGLACDCLLARADNAQPTVQRARVAEVLGGGPTGLMTRTTTCASLALMTLGILLMLVA